MILIRCDVYSINARKSSTQTHLTLSTRGSTTYSEAYFISIPCTDLVCMMLSDTHFLISTYL